MKSIGRAAFITLLIVVWAALAAVKLSDGLAAWSFARRSQTWTGRATATVEESRVIEESLGRRTEYSPLVRYGYSVSGRSYQGTVVDAPEPRRYDSRSRAAAVVARYPFGQTVPVIYDPQDPARCCLVPGDGGDAVTDLLLGSLLASMALGLLGTVAWVALRRRTFTFHRLNFSFRCPRGWKAVKGRSENDATLALTRGHLGCSINGSASETSYLETPERGASIRTEIIAGHADESRVVRREPFTHDGLEGVLLEVEAREGGLWLTYLDFCYARAGFHWEVMVYGDRTKVAGEQGLAVLDRMLPCFTILDRERSSFSRLVPYQGPHVSELYGHRLTTADGGWRQWPRRATDADEADFGLLHDASVIFATHPVTLPEGGLPMEALCAGLLGLADIEYPSAALERLDGDEDAAGARTFSYSRTINENAYEYRLHLRRWHRTACMLMLSCQPGNTEVDRLLDEMRRGLDGPDDGALPPEPSALDGGAKKRECRFLEGAGHWLWSRNQFDEARVLYGRWVERSPEDEGALHALLMAACRSERWQEALDELEKSGGRFAESLRIRAFRPYLLARLRRKDEAIEAYAAVFEAGWRDRDDAADFTELLIEAGRQEDAHALVASLREQEDGLWLHRLSARIKRAGGDTDGAIAELRAYADERPDDRDGALALANELLHAERYHDSVQICEDLVAGGRGSSEVYFTRGIGESRLEWYPQARRSFEEALKEAPQDRRVREWLDHVTTQLGHGSNQLIRRAIEPVDLPPPRGITPERTAPHADAPALFLERTVAYRFRRGEQLTWTTRKRLLVQTPAGAERWSTAYIPFDPEAEEVFVNEVRVRDENGDTVSVGRLEDYFVKDDEGPDGKTAKVVHVPVAGLAPGRQLDFIYTARLHGSPPAFTYRRLSLGGRFPALESVVEVRGDVAGLRTRTTGEVEESRRDDRLRFSARDVPGFEPEPYAPPGYRWQPTVWISDSEDSWAATAREYLDRIEDRLAPSEQLETLAREITAGCEPGDDTVAALASWVRREIRYKNIAFGPRGWMPEEAERVGDARFGDCKGHSILFYHLMRAAGQRCDLALVNTDDDTWDDVPTRWQFNHMLNFCPDYGGGRFVDCVDKGLGPGAEVPNGVAEQRALVLDRTSPRLAAIPPYPDDANRVELTREIECRPDGSLVTVETIAVTDNLGSYLRRWLAGQSAAERPQQVERYLQRLDPRLDLLSASFEHVDDLAAPVTLVLTYRLARALEGVGGRLVGALPAIWERDYLVPEVTAKRRGPVRVLMPYVIRSVARVRSADGSRRVTIPDAAEAEADDAFAVWTRRITVDDGAAEIVFDGRTKRGEHPPESYEAFRASMIDAIAAITAPVVLASEG